MNAIKRIILHWELNILKNEGLYMQARGKTRQPAMKNRIPANWRGVSYCNPILIPANADDHNRHAKIARMMVFRREGTIELQ
jgi:hypothetical protein